MENNNLDKDIFRQEIDLCGGHAVVLRDVAMRNGAPAFENGSGNNILNLDLSDAEFALETAKGAEAAKQKMVNHPPELLEEREKMTKTLSPEQKKAIQDRCDAMVAADGFDQEAKIRIVLKCLRVISQIRANALLSKILDEPIEAFVNRQVNNEDFTMVELVKNANEKAKVKLIKDEITVDDYSEFRKVKALLGDIVRERTLDTRLDAAEHMTDVVSRELETQKALEEVRTQIDGIIDKERNKSLHSGLAAIASYMKGALGKNCESVTISYVNEDNDYEKFDHLTRVVPVHERKDSTKGETMYAMKRLKESDFPEEIFVSQVNTKALDQKAGMKYFSVKLGKQCLGIIEVKMKDGQHLSDEQEKKCEKAISVINDSVYYSGILSGVIKAESADGDSDKK